MHGAAPPTFTAIAPGAGAQVAPPPGLLALAAEVERAKQGLASKGDLAPYFVGYDLSDLETVTVTAQDGALVFSGDSALRALGVDVRVGSNELDSTHPIDGGFDRSRSSPEFVPIESDSVPVLRHLAWMATDRAYRQAAERFLAVQAASKVKVDIEDRSGDFSREPAVVHYAPPAELALDRAGWERTARELSARFRGKAHVLSSSVTFEGRATTRWIANSDGTRIQTGEPGYRILVRATAKADDGMELSRTETFEAATLAGLPEPGGVASAIDQVIDDLGALRQAPPAEPYLGPAILVGRAAGVFFHEIFGHRMEGERQKSEEEGQTFAKKVGHGVMPSFISVYDDPTLARFGSTDLNGFYRFDNQGVPAQRASLVKSGVLEGFLMSRVPVRGVTRSNGHGRAALGAAPVARQANLVVETSRAVSRDELRRELVQEAERQGKDYGLLFAEIEGGFTQTQRFSTQGFKVLPVLVYRVFTDGRPDQLIRGVDIIGTPLTALTTILAAGDDYAVFNGTCGAESGWVPVSAVSPSLLVRKIEVALRDKGSDKSPVMAPPAVPASDQGSAP